MLKNLPSWTKASTDTFSNFGTLQKKLIDFFKENKGSTSLASTNNKKISATLNESNFSTKNYLLALKESLDTLEYCKFTQALLAFSEKKVGALEMIRSVKACLISENNHPNDMKTRINLFMLFKKFIPASYHTEIDAFLPAE